MNPLESFLEGLAQTPDDWDLRRVVADWCEENGQSGRADCLRWMSRQKKRPYQGSSGSASWFNAETIDPGLGDPESDIPGAVYGVLEGGTESANHKTFPSLRAAEEAFHAAFQAARAKGWRAEG
jgi:uncharacterized protein (TIGR02996 family)